MSPTLLSLVIKQHDEELLCLDPFHRTTGQGARQ